MIIIVIMILVTIVALSPEPDKPWFRSKPHMAVLPMGCAHDPWMCFRKITGVASAFHALPPMPPHVLPD